MSDYSGVRTMTAHYMTEVNSRHPVRQALPMMNQSNETLTQTLRQKPLSVGSRVINPLATNVARGNLLHSSPQSNTSGVKPPVLD